jgi:hypothetical protein
VKETNFGLQKKSRLHGIQKCSPLEQIMTTNNGTKISVGEQLMTIEGTDLLPSMKMNHDVGRNRR